MKSFLWILFIAPFLVKAEEAPWGLTNGQFGIQYCWSTTSSQFKYMNVDYFQFEKNKSIGLNTRLQFSLIDLIAQKIKPSRTPRFKVVDIIGFEQGLGYQAVYTNVDDIYSKFSAHTNTKWRNYGLDAGILAKIRLFPSIDIGAKLLFNAYYNAAFNNTYFVPQSVSTGRFKDLYVKAINWSYNVRIGRFYFELNTIRGKQFKYAYWKERLHLLYREYHMYPTYINVVDVKYRFLDQAYYSSYIGLQVGLGKTHYPDFHPVVEVRSPGYKTRNWIQLSYGIMLK